MRKMRKFAEGGRASRGQARYDRMIKDIESDYAKKKDRPGRAGEVAKAKYEQRMADAKDDLAKARGEDRAATRAAEKAAERNLSMTRKFGAVKTAVKADDVAKVSSTDDVLKSVPKPQMPSKASDTKPTPRRAAPTPTRRAPAKQEEKPAAAAKPAAATLPAPRGNITFGKQEVAKPQPKLSPGQTAYNARAAQTRADQAQRARWSSVEAQGAKDAKLYQLKAAAEAPGASQFAKDRYRMAKETGMYASGGTVKKKPTPPQPTPEEIRKRNAQNESLKKAKPTPADVSAIGRGNRSSGMKKGGTVMKKATKFGAAMKKKSVDTMGRAMMKKAGGGKCYAKGGSVSSRADGCATKGKTKGKMV